MNACAAACGAAVALALIAGNPPVQAQPLPTMTVEAFSMNADRTQVPVGQSFHLTIHVRIAEQRERLDELVLPTIGNATNLGDERRRTSDASGTDFYETLTVAGIAPGEATFSQAYVDAIDPRSHKSLRFSAARAVSVRITAPTVASVTSLPAVRGLVVAAGHILRFLGIIVGGVVVLAIVLALARAVAKRRPTQPPPIPASGAPPPRPAATPPSNRRDGFAAAANAYRIAPSEATLDDLRAALFIRAGARPGATTADALAALGGRDRGLAQLLSLAERARFGPRAFRADAQDALILALDRLA